MNTTRPYEAEDNQINKAAAALLIRYCAKLNDPIETLELYGKAAAAITSSGRHFTVNLSVNDRTFNAKFLYMKEEVAGKQTRIPKANW